MRVLLDTHAFLWLVTDAAQVSRTAREIFLDQTNELLLSSVSGFEICVKHRLGKLKLAESPAHFLRERVRNNALTVLPLRLEHTFPLAGLPDHHRDPFDRLLIAQAMTEGVPLLTADPAITVYPIETLW